jgi:hypothetical protein
MKALTVIISTTVVVLALAVWYVYSLAQWPTATVHAAPTGNKTASLTLNLVVDAVNGPHPDWVQYQTGDFNAHQSATLLKVPKSTWVTVTIHQYDSAGPLRNEYFNLVQGTKDGTAYWNGKPYTHLTTDQVGHTFTVPELGVNVPLPGVPDNATGDNPSETVSFTFYSGDTAATYHWQCFDPCGWGTYQNGGPMQTFGFMDGALIVA